MSENGASGTGALSKEAKEVQGKLSDFLTANPLSSIDEVETTLGKRIAVVKPWDDPSVILFVPEEPEELFEALNSVYLPERFSALWHRDTQDLEVIWSAYPVPPASEEVRKRKFTFSYGGKDYKCEYGESSERLLTIGGASRPAAATDTEYRNLQSFYSYVMVQEHDHEDSDTPRPLVGDPISFWIRDLEWDDDYILGFARHLNFYMTYFDARSPMMIIHSPRSEGGVSKPQTRYIADEFPSQIEGREIDDNLLHFWHAALIGDPVRRFQYYYRILEYASFTYLESATRQAVRRILSAPNALDQVSLISDRLVGAIQESKLDEYQRFEALIKETIDPGLLWREINHNYEAFSGKIEFDGGFVIPPLVAEAGSEDDFNLNGLANFCSSIRKIRNALAHGKDQRTSAVIAPTTANFRLLRPWLALVAVAAGQVMIYRRSL